MRKNLILVRVLVIGAALLTSFFNPSQAAVDSGRTLWSFAYFGPCQEDYFHRPSDIEIGPENSCIYVVDSGNHRVVVFDFDGRFIRTIGNKGQGPGEFSRPSGASICRDSSLAVADYGNNRIQIFDGSGKFLRSINTKEIRVADLVVIDDRFFTVPTYGTSGFNVNMGSDAEIQPLVVVMDGEGNVVDEFTSSDFPDTQPFIRAIKHRVCLALSPDRRLFLPFGALNVILVFDLDGHTLARFERALPFEPVPPELASQKTSRDGEHTVVQMRARIDMVSQAAHFGPDGNLFILTYAVSMDKWRRRYDRLEEAAPVPMRFDVIDPQSYTLIRTLECDAGARAFGVMDGGRVVYVVEDDAGELVLKCVQY